MEGSTCYSYFFFQPLRRFLAAQVQSEDALWLSSNKLLEYYYPVSLIKERTTWHSSAKNRRFCLEFLQNKRQTWSLEQFGWKVKKKLWKSIFESSKCLYKLRTSSIDLAGQSWKHILHSSSLPATMQFSVHNFGPFRLCVQNNTLGPDTTLLSTLGLLTSMLMYTVPIGFDGIDSHHILLWHLLIDNFMHLEDPSSRCE